MCFHERLRKLRKESPIMQKDIAKQIGVSVRTFQQYEQGLLEPNIEKLILLSKIFDVTVDFLICRNEYLSEVDVVESETNLPTHPND